MLIVQLLANSSPTLHYLQRTSRREQLAKLFAHRKLQIGEVRGWPKLTNTIIHKKPVIQMSRRREHGLKYRVRLSK